MTENELDNWLPHRLPMRFIDELVEIDEEHAAVIAKKPIDSNFSKTRMELFPMFFLSK